MRKYRLFLIISFIAFGCQKEVKVNREGIIPDLIYQPFGKVDQITRVVQAGDKAALLQIFDQKIHHVSGDVLKPDWTYFAPRSILNFINTSANHVLSVEVDYPLGFPFLYINRIDADGKLLFSGPWNEKLVTQHPYYSEELLAVCSDGNNGAYVLIFMEDMNGNQPAKRFLIHFNDNNVVDLRQELSDFYVYLQCDGKGQIFLTRSISSMGDFLKLQTIAYDETELLQNKTLKSNWNHAFSATEIDWKFLRYNPYSLNYFSNNLYFIKPDQTGANDEARGIEYVQINTLTGQETKRFYIPFGTNYNNWLNPSTFFAQKTENEHIIAYNFIGKSRVTVLDGDGNIKWTRNINGNENNTISTGVATIGNNIIICGTSTLKKGLTTIPFLYNFIPD